MSKSRLAAVIAVAFLAGSAVFGQVVWPPATFTPSAPTDQDEIVAEFLVPGGCGALSETTVVGTVVRTTFSGTCFGGPVPQYNTEFAAFGPLPAGTYTYEIYFDFEDDPLELRSQQPLVVAATLARIPTLNEWSRLALALALVAVAFVLLGRTSG